MFERLQKPFLTVETGEAYQPIRISYDILDATKLKAVFEKLNLLESKDVGGWNIFWRDECQDLHFESVENYKQNPKHPVRLGTFVIKNNILYLNLPSFKRACLLIPFFHRLIFEGSNIQIQKADFINKVFGLNERLPHGFAELFDENELEKIVAQRSHDYEVMHQNVEEAETIEEALSILANYNEAESHKRLPFAERFVFHPSNEDDPDIAYLAFYIFLRGRELVAIRRWFGETGYSLADAAEETMQQVFGNIDIDIIE